MLVAIVSVVLAAAPDAGDRRPVLLVVSIDAGKTEHRTLDAPEVRPLLERFRVEQYDSDARGLEALEALGLRRAPAMAVATASGDYVDLLLDWEPRAFAADLAELAEIAVADPTPADASGLFLAARAAERIHDLRGARELLGRAEAYHQRASERAAYVKLAYDVAAEPADRAVALIEAYLEQAHRVAWRLNALEELALLSPWAPVDAKRFVQHLDALDAELVTDVHAERRHRLARLRQVNRGAVSPPLDDPFEVATPEVPPAPAPQVPKLRSPSLGPPPTRYDGPTHPCVSITFTPHEHCNVFVWVLFSGGFEVRPLGGGIETGGAIDLELQFRRARSTFFGWGPTVDLGTRHEAQWLFEPGVGISYSWIWVEANVVGGVSVGFRDGQLDSGFAKLSVWFIQHLAGVDLALHGGRRGLEPVVGLRFDLGALPLIWLTPWKIYGAYALYPGYDTKP